MGNTNPNRIRIDSRRKSSNVEGKREYIEENKKRENPKNAI